MFEFARGRATLLSVGIGFLALACGGIDGQGAPEDVGRVKQGLSSDLLTDVGKKSLIIVSKAVVNDPQRSQPDPCLAVPADAAKKWTLGYLLTQASSATPSATTASSYVTNWIKTWTTDQTVNNQKLAALDPITGPLGVGQRVRDEWLAKSNAGSTYKMQFAPFRLSAIVPRFDLRKRRRFGEGLAGELRFVFGHVSALHVDSGGVLENAGGCETERQSTVILEYAVDKANENDVVKWANDWYALSNETMGSSAYLSKLEALTESVVKAGKGSPYGRPNGSELLRIRANENPSVNGKWRLREWNIDPTSKLPVAVTVKQSPIVAMRDEKSSFVGTWANSNTASILNDTYVVPDVFPWGPRMLGAEDIHDTNGGDRKEWRVGFNDPEVRHKLNKGTCNGCHSTETNTFFAHIEPRFRNDEAPLSQFLVGNGPYEYAAITDPVSGQVRYFNEAADREADLVALAFNWSIPPATGITSPSLATFYRVANVTSNLCLDVAGQSTNNGALLQQWTCSGNANQRLTLIDLGNGYYNLRVKNGSNKCMQASASANGSGEWLVTQQTCSSSATSQQLQLANPGYYTLRFRNTGRCLDIANNDLGTKALQKSCNDSWNQQFYFFE